MGDRSQPRQADQDTGRMLIEYTFTGGMPPSSFESLRVFAGGRVTALVGNAWAEGARQNEAGRYETTLDEEETRSLKKVLAAPKLRAAEETYGDFFPGSAIEMFRFPESSRLKNIEWSAGSDLPGFLDELRGRLRKTLERAKDSARTVVRFEVASEAGEARSGDAVRIRCELVNPGVEEVSIVTGPHAGGPPLPALRYLFKRPDPVEEQFVPLLEVYQAGEVAGLDRLGLAPMGGKDLVLEPGSSAGFSIEVRPTPAAQGAFNLFVLLELVMRVDWDAEGEESYSIAVVSPLKIRFTD